MDRSAGAGASPGLQVIVISAVAATLGIVAGGALVYLQQRRSSGEQSQRRHFTRDSVSTGSVSTAVPLFDSVQASVLLTDSGQSYLQMFAVRNTGVN